MILENDTYLQSRELSSCKSGEMPEFFIAEFSSYDVIILDLARRNIDFLIVVIDGIPYFESFAFFTEDAELVEIHLAVYCEYPLGTDIGIFQNRERKPSYSIGGNCGNIDKRCHKEPARLDKYSSNQGFLDDTQRRLLVFHRSSSAAREYTSNDSKEDHKSQCEICEVFHHIPKLPQWRIEMEYGRINKRIVERKSSDNQEWSEQEIDEFEEEIEDLPDTHRGPCTGIG